MVKWDEKFRGKGLVVIQLYSGCFDDLKSLREHVEQRKLAFPIAHDPGGETHQKYLRRKSFPIGYLVGADGKVAWEGPVSNKKDRREEIEGRIEKALESVKPEEPGIRKR